ncbi:MAG: DUF2971 domain-containing protein [Candidatus Omnitrophota bacterium]
MHDRTSFYKYVSAEVAKIILVNQTLRWSSPLLFDDPYDVTRVLAADIKISEIQECLIDRIIYLVKNDVELSLEMNPKLRFVLEHLRRSNRDDVKEKICQAMQDSKTELLKESPGLDELRKMWKEMAPTFRILCFSARNNIMSMWDRCADKFRGVVLEFSCLKEFDSPWLIAEPVRYEDRSSLLDKTGWGVLVTLNQSAATKYIFNESCHTKTLAWSYQEEWRIVSFNRKGEKGEYSDYRFNPQELTAVYLGPEISVENKEIVIALLKHELSHVKVYFGKTINGSCIEFSLVLDKNIKAKEGNVRV